MQKQLRALASHFFRNAAAYAVLSIGLALTVAAHEYVAANLHVANKRSFDEETEDVLGRLRRRVDTYKTMVLATRALFTGTSVPTKNEFEAFARHLQMPEYAPGMHGLGFAIFPTITPPSDQIPAPLLADAIEPQYSEPVQTYVQLGDRVRGMPADRWIDHPLFRETIGHARDHGRPAASPRISIESCNDDTFSPGFALYVPIFAPGELATVDQRRQAMRGAVFATFCTPKILSGMLHAQTRRTIDIEIYDGTEAKAEALIADTDPVARAIDEHSPQGEKFVRDVEFEVAGRKWLVHFEALGAADQATAAMLPRLVAFGGVMLTFLLFAIVLSQVRSRGIAETGERRSKILANASRVFSSYADEREALKEITQLTVPYVADWCAISFFEGSTPEVFHFGLTGAERSTEEKLLEACRVRPSSSLLSTGQTELVTDVRYGGSESSIPEEVLVEVGARSIVRAPMTRQGELLGMVTLITTRPMRRLGPSDVLLASELARIICTAVDGARLYRRTQEASRLKDEFLATLSHELRTPLNAILGWSHLLRSAALEESTRQRALETIERNARQQNQIVSDLLDVSRIILGQVNLDRAPVDLATTVNDAIESQRLAAQAKHIAVTVRVEPAASVVLGDRARLHQIVWNLVSNALKFTPNDGRVEVELARDGDFAEIRVKDTGQGISPEFLPHIFERFRQADASSTRAHGGLGLGLAIVRHLVELHGGTIHATSEGPGKGSTFVARIPAVAKTVATLDSAKREAERRGNSISGDKQQAG